MPNQCIAVANSKTFQGYVKYELQKASVNVLGESAGGADQPTLIEHQKRVIYANKVLNGEISIYEAAVTVTTNDTIKSKIEANDESYKNDIAFVVASVFSDLSGYDQLTDEV